MVIVVSHHADRAGRVRPPPWLGSMPGPPVVWGELAPGSYLVRDASVEVPGLPEGIDVLWPGGVWETYTDALDQLGDKGGALVLRHGGENR